MCENMPLCMAITLLHNVCTHNTPAYTMCCALQKEVSKIFLSCDHDIEIENKGSAIFILLAHDLQVEGKF